METRWLKKFAFATWETVEVAVIALATVFIIRQYLMQPFLVSGASMEPSFSDDNYLLIDQLTYHFRDPERGEVIVFKYPLNPSTFFIKRAIALPGEEVEARDGKIIVRKGGEEITLDESYVPASLKTSDNFTVRLSTDQYFVMGDNRSHSFDSRNWGAVSRKNIVGVARVRVLPLDDFTFFKPPAYSP